MKDPILRVVLFPRPTAIWGTSAVSSEPFRSKDFCQAVVVAGARTGMGATPATVSVTLEQSADGVRWFTIGSALTPAANDEDTDAFDLDLEWMRATATVTGGSPGVTMWAVAGMVPRVSSGQ